jgi:hypothetical protein
MLLAMTFILLPHAGAQTHTPSYCVDSNGNGLHFNPDRPDLTTPVRTLSPLVEGRTGTLCIGRPHCTIATLELTQPSVVVQGSQIEVEAQLYRFPFLSNSDCGQAGYLAVQLPPLSAGTYQVEYDLNYEFGTLGLQTLSNSGVITVGAAPTPIPVFGVQGLLWLIVAVGVFGLWQHRRPG